MRTKNFNSFYPHLFAPQSKAAWVNLPSGRQVRTDDLRQNVNYKSFDPAGDGVNSRINLCSLSLHKMSAHL
jgi:hypothetical protein